jgi:hypothetical protein
MDNSMKKLGDILKQTKLLDDSGKYITREFQEYGYRLAVDLKDLSHKALYIKLAKEVERELLEETRRYVIDANVRNRAALFMWRLSELRKTKK